MKDRIAEYTQHCRECQLYKLKKVKYAKLNPTQVDVNVDVFECIALDIVGPIEIPDDLADEHDFDYEYKYILTIIDIASRYVELVALENVQGPTVCKAFDDTWLCRYPRCKYLITD